jgi:flagellar hook-length control protein FliK
VTVSNISNLGANQTQNISNKASKTKNQNALGDFGTVMLAGTYQNTNQTISSVSDSTKASSYDYGQSRSQSRDTSVTTIPTAENATAKDKIAGASEELKDFDENVVQTVCDDLGVDEDAVLAAMEALGMTVFDLMDPAKLTQLSMQLTGAEDATDMLMNAGFQSLLGDVGQLTQTLAKQVDVTTEQLSNLTEELNTVLTSNDETDGMEVSELSKKLTTGTDIFPEDAVPEQKSVLTSDVPEQTEVPVETQTAEMPEASETRMDSDVPEESMEALAQTKEGFTVEVEDLRDDSSKTESVKQDGGAQQSEQAADTEYVPSGQTADAGKKSDGKKDSSDFSESRNPFVQQMQITEPQDKDIAPVFESAFEESTISYTDVDTLDIIEQIAENAKIILQNDSTTMEMQLNPENLGRIYLNVSAKEGSVNAQIAAENNAVKEALEMQLATLREHLNQAGVKVDAIEVTVESHAFERNLEQGAHQQEEEGRRQEEQTSGRRNIRLDSLDELSGLMTEEEALAAQIMKDNGNSVDLTA